jgi:hypothetical protein
MLLQILSTFQGVFHSTLDADRATTDAHGGDSGDHRHATGAGDLGLSMHMAMDEEGRPVEEEAPGDDVAARMTMHEPKEIGGTLPEAGREGMMWTLPHTSTWNGGGGGGGGTH